MAEAPTTQCPFCGAPLTVEGDYCPNCGSKKIQFKEHRQKMKAFNKAFEETKEGVVAENVKASKIAAYITVIAVLAVIILAEVICLRNSYGIGRSIKAGKVKSNSEVVLNALETYVDNEDFIGFMTHYENYDLYTLRDEPGFRQYQLLYTMCNNYEVAFKDLCFLVNPSDYYEAESEEYYEHMRRNAENIGYYLSEFNKYYKKYIDEYNPGDEYEMYHSDCYTPKLMETYKKLRENFNSIVSYYLEIPYEEVEGFKDLREAEVKIRISQAVEEKYIED